MSEKSPQERNHRRPPTPHAFNPHLSAFKKDTEFHMPASNASLEEEFEKGVFTCFIEYSVLGYRAPFKSFLEQVERIIITRTLSMFNGKQKDAAKFLGIKYTTLNEKVKKYHIAFRKTPVQGK